MAFNYETLKKYKSESFVDLTVQSTDIDNLAVNSDKIADGNVTSTKLGTNSVDLSSNKVSGTLATSKGGLGTGQLTSAYQLIRSDGDGTVSSSIHGIINMSVYTGNSTWSRPSGCKWIKVQVQGGGGGGSGHGEAGGAGGYAEEWIDVSSISSVSVTIGGRGGPSYYSGAGGNGGTSSFGPYLSAGLGYGANRNNQHSGGVSGSGSGGSLNIHTGGGGNHHQRTGYGGSSFWGGNTAGGHPQGGQFTYNHRNHAAWGSGGSGGYFYGNRGAQGRQGVIVVTAFA